MYLLGEGIVALCLFNYWVFWWFLWWFLCYVLCELFVVVLFGGCGVFLGESGGFLLFCFVFVF